MAQSIAPYNNGMRLGQGFNSYTQQICLDRAVLENTPTNWARVKASYTEPIPGQDDSNNSNRNSRSGRRSLGLLHAESPKDEENKGDEKKDDEEQEDDETALTEQNVAGPERPPWTKPQIVTYSSRFVDKLSEVTDSMNISGALSIQTATVGGTATGSYVDSDKFKESDINFHLQVKVTNQILDAKEYNLFNKIKNVDPKDFTAIYGDTFISGWEEGGELNAIISMKVSDKSKIFEIKASLEAQVSLAAVKGKVSGKFEMEKDSLSKSTETTVAVNWSGGGSIKDPEEAWTITSIQRAAAAFPDLVAICPQRTYAILTKYTALESFQRQKDNYSLLDYENAGIYTGALLDHYMDYKLMWKQLSMATYELEQLRATIEWTQMPEELYKLANIQELPENQKGQKLRQSNLEYNYSEQSTDSRQAALAVIEDALAKGDFSQQAVDRFVVDLVGGEGAQQRPRWVQLKPFTPTFAGLIKARKLCRVEMAKIVNEVDLVTRDPKIALERDRDSYFLHPLVFKQLLPIVRCWTDDMLTGGMQSNAPLILGYSPPVEMDKALPELVKYYPEVKKPSSPHRDWLLSTQRLRGKARDYRMQGAAGQVNQEATTTTPGAKFFNDLQVLDPTYRPTAISVWQAEGTHTLDGIKIRYANGEDRGHGMCEGGATKTLELASDGSEVIFEVVVGTVTNDKNNILITSLKIVTSHYRELEFDVRDTGPATSNAAYTWNRPNLDERWSVRGFFGFEVEKTGPVSGFGVVFGKDSFVPVPVARLRLPMPSFWWFTAAKEYRENIRTTNDKHPEFAGNFIIGNVSDLPETKTGEKEFSALSATSLALDWKIKTIKFSVKNEVLSALRVIYTNGQVLDHPPSKYDEGNKDPNNWECTLESDIIACKFRAGKKKDPADSKWRIQTIELILGTDNGRIPDWPLNLSTARFLGAGDAKTVDYKDMLTETAPKLDKARWSVRGFFGRYVEAGAATEITRLGVIWGREMDGGSSSVIKVLGPPGPPGVRPLYIERDYLG